MGLLSEFVISIYVSLLLSLSLVYGDGIPTTLDGPFKPVTIPLDKSFRGNATDLPEFETNVQGEFQIGDNISSLDPESVQSIVQFRVHGSSSSYQAEGYSLIYSQLYTLEGLQNYTSGIIHHVLLTGLEPNTLYQYECGDPSIQLMSNSHYFRTMPVSSPSDYPNRIAVICITQMGLHQIAPPALFQKLLLVKHISLAGIIGEAEQYKWLERDLGYVDREVTPWLVASWHPAWYSTYVAHYREAECMRIEMEDLLYSNGVDIVFNGHVHGYERSNRVYNYSLDPCGPVYITIGDGGNREGLDIKHADEPGNCPDPLTTPDSYMGGFCAFNFSSGPASGKFCWDRQPEYSAYRESSFGHGILEVRNQTHALWTWHRNQEFYQKAGDIIYIVREPEKCPFNQK